MHSKPVQRRFGPVSVEIYEDEGKYRVETVLGNSRRYFPDRFDTEDRAMSFVVGQIFDGIYETIRDLNEYNGAETEVMVDDPVWDGTDLQTKPFTRGYDYASQILAHHFGAILRSDIGDHERVQKFSDLVGRIEEFYEGNA